MKLFLILIFFSTIVLSNDNVMNLDSSEITKEFNLENELALLRAQYDKPPRLKKKLKIKEEKYKGLDRVIIKFFITKKGKVSEISIIKSSGNNKFDKDIFSAIKKSKWKAAVKNSEEIDAWHLLSIKF